MAITSYFTTSGLFRLYGKNFRRIHEMVPWNPARLVPGDGIFLGGREPKLDGQWGTLTEGLTAVEFYVLSFTNAWLCITVMEVSLLIYYIMSEWFRFLAWFCWLEGGNFRRRICWATSKFTVQPAWSIVFIPSLVSFLPLSHAWTIWHLWGFSDSEVSRRENSFWPFLLAISSSHRTSSVQPVVTIINFALSKTQDIPCLRRRSME